MSLFISPVTVAVFGCLHTDVVAAHEKKVTPSRAAYNQLVEHVADDEGRDVASADLDEGQRIELPALIRF